MKQTEPCPTCGKPLHWRRKRFLTGRTSSTIGRPRADYVKINFLVKEGHSYSTIAHMLGTSSTTVWRAVRKFKGLR